MFLDPLFKLMAEKQASDLFFTAGAPIQIKINGVRIDLRARGNASACRDDGSRMHALDDRCRRVQRRSDARVGEVRLGVHEACDGAGVAVARRDDDGGRTGMRKLRAIERVGQERDGIGRGAGQRADAIHDDAGITVELAPELRRELA